MHAIQNSFVPDSLPSKVKVKKGKDGNKKVVIIKKIVKERTRNPNSSACNSGLVSPITA